MKLDPEKTRHAVNIAGVACAALRQARVGELSHWKGVAFANAARLGVYCGAARAGGDDRSGADFRGTNGIREGTWRFVRQCRRSFDKTKEAMPGRAGIDDFEHEHQILAGGISQPKRDRGGAVLAQGNRRSGKGEIDAIESHDASVDIIGSEPEKWKPETRETADHSLPYITAIALIDGEVTDKQFAPERFTRPEDLEISWRT